MLKAVFAIFAVTILLSILTTAGASSTNAEESSLVIGFDDQEDGLDHSRVKRQAGFLCGLFCSDAYSPKCARNGKTYRNSCLLRCERQVALCSGQCPCTRVRANPASSCQVCSRSIPPQCRRIC